MRNKYLGPFQFLCFGSLYGVEQGVREGVCRLISVGPFWICLHEMIGLNKADQQRRQGGLKRDYQITWSGLFQQSR